MYDKSAINPGIYTDFQGLDKLHAQAVKNPQAAKKAVAQQFEAILMQMMLTSMREANKTFNSDLLDSNQMDFYQDIYDKQLSLVMSQHGIGLAAAIERNIDASNPPPVETLPPPSSDKPRQITSVPSDLIAAAPAEHDEPPAILPVMPKEQPVKEFDSSASFVKALWPAAKTAASVLGVTPELLVAQAALETDWGKKILVAHDNTSSHNVFNIKTDANWTDASTTVDSLEEKNGVLVKEKSSFKNYDSFMSSFMDYAKLLKDNLRYSNVVKAAADPQKFVQALQNAGYATDSHYGEKILKIFSSRSFQELVGTMR